MKKWKIILSVFPVLFLIENIFGYNGTMIMIFGKAIRHWLYLLTFFSLIIQFVICLKEEGYKVISIKGKSYLKQLSGFDWCAVLLCLAFFIWMTVIPILKGGNLSYAKRDAFDALCILILYFPLLFLLKKKWYNWRTIENIIYVSVIIQSIQNVALYFLETAIPGFMNEFFGIWVNVFEDSILPPIILGHGNTARVLFSTSLFLFLALMICLKRILVLKEKEMTNYLALVVFVLAILCTMTKSIWYGFLGAGIIVICVRVFWDRKTFFTRELLKVIIIVICVTVAADFTIFNNRIADKIENAFSTSHSTSEEEPESDNEELEREASTISNDIKIEQIEHLLNKWKESPIWGHGYGAYCEDYLRSEEAVFSYEMLAPALLMKLGVMGMLVWAIYFIGMLRHCYKKNSSNYFTIWLFILFSYGIAIQTNPFMFSFAGIITILYCALSAENNA